MPPSRPSWQAGRWRYPVKDDDLDLDDIKRDQAALAESQKRARERNVSASARMRRS
jgi:hypothetical protein